MRSVNQSDRDEWESNRQHNMFAKWRLGLTTPQEDAEVDSIRRGNNPASALVNDWFGPNGGVYKVAELTSSAAVGLNAQSRAAGANEFQRFARQQNAVPTQRIDYVPRTVAPISVTTGSAYNAANFGDVLGNWSRANGYVPARNIAGLTVNKVLRAELWSEFWPNCDGRDLGRFSDGWPNCPNFGERCLKFEW